MPLRDRFDGTQDLYLFLKNVVLKNYLGVYTYTINNAHVSIPSIYVVKNKDMDPPTEWSRSGIECLILPSTIKARSYLTSNGVILIQRFRLIQHDRSRSLTDSNSDGNPSIVEWIIRQLPTVVEESYLTATIDREEQATYSIAKITV